MRINPIYFLLYFFVFFSCAPIKVFEPDLNIVYYHKVGSVSHEIKFLDKSNLRMTQIFDCKKLTDSLRAREILVNYEVIKSHKVKPSKESKKIIVHELKLKNLSNDNFEYPIIENDLDCLFLNEYNREDRTVFENKFQISTFKKLNIITFNESQLFFRTNDSSISFALKVFKTANVSD